MKLIKCGHCGRPYYDDSETCPYCGHVPGSSPQTADAEQKATSNSTDGTAQAAPVPDTTPSESQPENANPQPAETITPVADTDTDNVADAAPTSLRAESIAAAVASGPLTNSDDDESSPLSDPNQVETILPPRRRHPWLWLLLILLLAAIAAAAYIYRDALKQIITSLIS